MYVLKPTAKLRIRGVNMDDQLTFTEHIRDIRKKSEKENRGAIKATQPNLIQDQASTVPNSNSSSSDVLPDRMAFL